MEPAPAGQGREPAHRLRLPSADARPFVDVRVHPDEALVRVGRHEQLFGWGPESAEEATEEVLSYVEGIIRPPGSIPAAGGWEDALTGEQRSILVGVDEALCERGAVSRAALGGPTTERHVELSLLLPPERRLEVSVSIAPDVFALDVNGAVLQLHRVDFGDEGPAWAECCVSTVRSLLDEELVLRVRRTLLGRRVGALRVPRGVEPPTWNGEAMAVLGLGRTRRFSRWWSAE